MGTHRIAGMGDVLPGERYGVVAVGLHWLLAVLIVATFALGLYMTGLPLSGWAYTASAGLPVVLFGVLPLPDLVAVDRKAADSLFKPLHHGAAFALAATVLLHSAAALFHHFARGGGFLQRIWSRPRRG